MLKRSRLIILLLFSFLISYPRSLHPYEIQRRVIKTADGVELVAKRYYNPGGIPVILQHGFAVNFVTWDFPGRSFAKYLADRGYDVWVTNLRGHGEGEYQSGPNRGPGNWDFDTFLVYDIPAMIKTVTKVTGKKPFWAGHSMGGTMMYAYLGGAYGKLVSTPAGKVLKMFSSSKVAKEHNAQIRGFVAVSSPAGLSFPVSLKGKGLKGLLKYNYYDYDLLLQIAASYPWEKIKGGIFILTHNETIVDKLHITPPVWANNFTAHLLLNILSPIIYKYLGEKFPGDLGEFVHFVKKHLGVGPLDFILNMIWNTKNTTKKDIYYIIEHGLDNFSPRLLHQWHMWLRNDTFQELCDYKGCKPCDYFSGLKRITVPTLLLVGGKDKLVSRKNIKDKIYKIIPVRDKKYVVFPKAGHVDILMGKNAVKVFETTYRWLKKH